MQNELPPQDPKTVWQNQRLEATQMSIEEIRSKARSFERKIRRRNLREYLASAFIAAAFAFFAWRFPLPVMRVGFIAVAVGALCFAFELDRRGSLQTEPKGTRNHCVAGFLYSPARAPAQSARPELEMDALVGSRNDCPHCRRDDDRPHS